LILLQYIHNIPKGKRMKISTLILPIIALSLIGCTNTNTPIPTKPNLPTRTYYAPTPSKQPLFQRTMRKVALSTKDDPNYHKMALDTPEKKTWFRNLMYALWDRQMTRSEFIAEGLKKYPSRRYEFTFVANGFQKNS